LRADVERRGLHPHQLVIREEVTPAAPMFSRRQTPDGRPMSGRRRELEVDADEFPNSIER
jgi:hypothetical protein